MEVVQRPAMGSMLPRSRTRRARCGFASTMRMRLRARHNTLRTNADSSSRCLFSTHPPQGVRSHQPHEHPGIHVGTKKSLACDGIWHLQRRRGRKRSWAWSGPAEALKGDVE